MIRKLFKIERQCKDKSAAQRHALRQELAVPVLDTLETWLAQQAQLTPPKSPLGRAIGYARRQWAALRRYTEDGDLPIDNGRTERALRGIAVGRKNWLFAGSHSGGHRAAHLYSLIATCKRHRVDPAKYLRDVLTHLPAHPRDQMDELTPLAWAKRQAEPKAGA